VAQKAIKASAILGHHRGKEEVKGTSLGLEGGGRVVQAISVKYIDVYDMICNI